MCSTHIHTQYKLTTDITFEWIVIYIKLLLITFNARMRIKIGQILCFFSQLFGIKLFKKKINLNSQNHKYSAAQRSRKLFRIL